MSAGEEEGVDWKAQYEDMVQQLQDAQDQAKQEHADLSEKCEKLEKENKKLLTKLNEEKNKVKEVNQLIEPALDEFTKLQSKYKIEKGCRHEAEIYASKIVQQNKKLKRQSMDLIAVLNKSSMPLHMMDINLEEEDKEEKTLENGYQETLNAVIKELKNEISILTASLTRTKDELQVEKENHRWAASMYKSAKEQLQQTELSLKQHKDAMKQLSSVSEAAYEEYENLKEQYDLEVKRRSVFERKIEEVAVMNNKMKRQSEVLLMKLSPGDQLHKALVEIEDLTDKLEQQRKYYDAEISKLEGKVEDNTSHKADTESIQMERLSLETEKEELLRQIQEYQEKYSKLVEQYDILQKKYEEAKHLPPPPPPPPPPEVHTSKGFLSKIIRKKKVDKEAKLKVGGANVNPDFSKALEEMMSNIQRGKTLRPTLKPIRRNASQEEESKQTGSAMSELQNIMKKMKRNNSESDLLSPVETQHAETELAKTFRRIKKSASADPIPDVQRRDKLSIVSEERDSEVFLRNLPAES